MGVRAQIYLTEELVALAGQRVVLVRAGGVLLLGVGNTMALQIVLELEVPAAHLARKLFGLVHQLVALQPERGGELLAADTAGVHFDDRGEIKVLAGGLSPH